jgi:transcription initiation factor TFIIB
MLQTLRSDFCPECGTGKVCMDYGRGEVFCDKCGLVISDSIIDEGADWRSYSAEEDSQKNRTGEPLTVLMHDKGLTTEIDHINRDYYGSRLNSRARAQMARLRRWQYRCRIANSSERNLVIGLQEIKRMGTRLGIPDNVIKTAAYLHRKAVDKRLIVGRSTLSIASASLYAACRNYNYPRTLDEIAAVSKLNKSGAQGRKEVAHSFRVLRHHLSFNVHIPTALDYLGRFCSKLDVDDECAKGARDIVESIQDTELSIGKSPVSVAAASIYIAARHLNKKVKQKHIADVAGITEVTIRNRYKDIEKHTNVKDILCRTHNT